MTKKTLLKILFLCMIAFVAIGCSKELGEDAQLVSPDHVEPIVANDDPQDTTSDGPIPPAREINRGGEEYDYTGWMEEYPDPDIYMLVEEDWFSGSVAVIAGTSWGDLQNKDAILIYQFLSDVTIPPNEAIWKNYGSIIEKGGDVEYGVFISKYLAEAYYVKYIENGYLHIVLYFFFFPQTVYMEMHDSPQMVRTLIYTNLIDKENIEGTLKEEAFWKVAQSIFLRKDYGENSIWIPYIPEIDGSSIWEGGGHGIVPTDMYSTNREIGPGSML